MLSISSWRISWPRLAPIDSRTAISWRRVVASASSRLATLAQAMSSTSATTTVRSAPAVVNAWRCAGTGESVVSASGTTVPVRPRLSIGKSSASASPTAADVGGGAGAEDAGLQPSDHLHQQRPPRVPVLGQEAGGQLAVHRERHPQGGDAEEPDAGVGLAGHADHGERQAVHGDGAADDVGRAAVAALPQAVAEHGDRAGPGRGVLGVDEAAAEGHRRAEGAEVVAGHELAEDLLGLAGAARERERQERPPRPGR